MTLAGGVCSEVFFAFCPVAVPGLCQEKLLMLECFSSEQLGRGALVPWETPRCGSSWAPFWLPEIPELIYQASMEHFWHGDLLGSSVLQMCMYATWYTCISVVN